MTARQITRPALATALLVSGLVGCSPQSPPAAESPAPTPEATARQTEDRRATALQRGGEIVSQAGKALSSVLLEAIRQGGPTNALPLCSVQAIPLTTSLAQANQVQLRRVSHRPRNPLNQANELELAILDRFKTQLASGTKPDAEVVLTESGGSTFYAPIVISTNLCLRCHGQTDADLDPEIIPLLQQLYPQDQATGFALGDLRGLWRVDFPTP